jgi:hypothetical protein
MIRVTQSAHTTTIWKTVFPKDNFHASTPLPWGKTEASSGYLMVLQTRLAMSKLGSCSSKKTVHLRSEKGSGFNISRKENFVNVDCLVKGEEITRVKYVLMG